MNKLSDYDLQVLSDILFEYLQSNYNLDEITRITEMFLKLRQDE